MEDETPEHAGGESAASEQPPAKNRQESANENDPTDLNGDRRTGADSEDPVDQAEDEGVTRSSVRREDASRGPASTNRWKYAGSAVSKA